MSRELKLILIGLAVGTVTAWLLKSHSNEVRS